MPLELIRNDITTMRVDAIVNAARNSLLGGGGVDGCIHRAAGPGLLAECKTLGGCETGQAKLTGAYRLPCKYVIHTVGPVWNGGTQGERALLRSCYRSSLELALAHQCETVAFPLISAGSFGYPPAQALDAALEAIREFLLEHEMTVYLVLHGRSAYLAGKALFPDLAQYIDDLYVRSHAVGRSETLFNTPVNNAGSAKPAQNAAPPSASAPPGKKRPKLTGLFHKKEQAAPLEDAAQPPHLSQAAYSYPNLEELVSQVDESFSQMLLRKIDERGMTDAQCYKKANIDRRLFSKIRGDVHYKPSKPTALAFAVALELPLDETKELLMKAGYALSHSSQFDIIVEYFIVRREYNIFRINEALFSFDQSLLGA